MTPDHFKPIPIEDWPAPAEAACDIPSGEYHYHGLSHPDYIESCNHLPMNSSNGAMRLMADEAVKICTGERQVSYGLPEVNHKRTAAFWSIFLGIEITPLQVCLMNDLQKTARLMECVTRDGLLDKVGFVLNGEACRQSDLPVNGT